MYTVKTDKGYWSGYNSWSNNIRDIQWYKDKIVAEKIAWWFEGVVMHITIIFH